MRLFVALDIEDDIRDRILRYMDGVRGFAPDARWVRPESLHVTLKFIGEQPDGDVENINRALEAIPAQGFKVKFCGHGFFPNPRAPRVFWIGMEADPKLASLAASVDEKLATLGISKEEHAFNPHLTLARAAGSSRAARKSRSDGGPGGFRRLLEKLAALPAPEFGTMTPRKFFLYQSQLSSKGSKYTKLAGFPLQ